jgi:phosphate:Na+ symporter
MVPERPEPVGIKAVFLDDIYLEHPAMALDQVRRELVRLGDLVRDMLTYSMYVTVSGNEGEVARLKQADDDVDTLYGEIIRYLGKLSQGNLVLKQPQQLGDFVGVANYLENIGDVIEKDLLAIAGKRIRNGTTISSSTAAKLKPIDEKVLEVFDRVLTVLATGSNDEALEAIDSKEIVNDLAREATAHLAKRLVVDEPDRLQAFQIETDIIESYRRINVYSRRIAKLCLKLHHDRVDKED